MICDIIILNIIGSRSVYKDAKFEVLTKDDIQAKRTIDSSESKKALERSLETPETPATTSIENDTESPS